MKNSKYKTRQEYERQQAVREWNATFSVPPVCAAQWKDADWQAWQESRKPLPPFEEWQKECEK